MKRLPTVFALIVSSVIAAPVLAGLASSIDSEFLRLREKRDQALATVAEPINEGYRASLEKLLKRAIDEKDKESAAKIQFELQSIGAAGTSPTLPTTEPAPAATPEMIALQKALAETKWRLNRDKTFLLHADGSSTSNWTPRKGHWKVLDATTVELDIGNIRRQQKVTVSQGATMMTWQNREADELHPEVAKKIEPIPEK